MNAYKILRIRTNHYGDSQLAFVAADGKAYRFQMAGRIWAMHSEGGFSAKKTVVQLPDGLFMYEAFKSRTAKPLALAVGETYLPISTTGGAMFLKELPK